MSHALARILTVILVLALAGCASPLPGALQQEPPRSPDVRTVHSDPQAHVGERVRWGGTIIGTENLAAGSQIEVLAQPLDSDGRPRPTEPALGRFIARSRQFVDPLIYKANSEITLGGTLGEPLTRHIGAFPYTYPVVETDALHRWAPRPVPHDPAPYWYDPWYPWGYPYPWWRHPYHPFW